MRKAAVRSANQLRLLPTQTGTTEFHATLQLRTSKKGTSLGSRVLALTGGSASAIRYWLRKTTPKPQNPKEMKFKYSV